MRIKKMTYGLINGEEQNDELSLDIPRMSDEQK